MPFKNIVGGEILVNNIYFYSQFVFLPIRNKSNTVKPVLETTCIKRPPTLTLSQTTNFRLFQTERLCRRQFQILITIAESSPNGYKTLWEKEKLLISKNRIAHHSLQFLGGKKLRYS